MNMTAHEWIDQHEEDFINDICSLIRIPSVSMPGSDPEAPFGKDCRKMLNAVLALGESMGFQTENHENYCGSIIFKGDSDEEIGLFGHGDVVPEGSGWSSDPFEPVIRDGIIVGRGASDNKGSFMSALYALKYLKDSGWRPEHTFRFIIGCNEECGMKDAEYYVSHYREPVFTLVPDVTFPVCNGEKGALSIKAVCDKKSSVLHSFSSGVITNAVPGHAEALLNISDEEAELLNHVGVRYTRDDEFIKAETDGISAHAAFPEGSESAEVKLAEALLEAGILDEAAAGIMEAVSSLFSDYYGEGLGIACEDDVSGRLTHVGGTAEYKDSVFHQTIDIRYCISADPAAMIDTIQKKLAGYDFRVEDIKNNPPCYRDASKPEIRELVEICNAHLGTDLNAYVMGGGTYARKLKNAVGYGPGIPGGEKIFGDEKGGAHQPDEYVRIEDLKKAFEIYTDALVAVDRIIPCSRE